MPIPSAAHFLKINSNFYIASSLGSHNKMAVYGIDIINGELVSIYNAKGYEDNLIGEGLSLAKLDENHAIITIPESFKIGVWNFRENNYFS